MSENADDGDGVGLRNVGRLEQISVVVDFNVHSIRGSQINWVVNMNHRVSPHGGGIKIMALWKATACSSVVTYRRCLGVLENGGSRLPRNVGQYYRRSRSCLQQTRYSEPQFFFLLNTILILKYRCAFAGRICKLSC